MPAPVQGITDGIPLWMAALVMAVGSTLSQSGQGSPGGSWLVDDTASTEERMMLYYSRPLAAGNSEAGIAAGESSLFADQISIDGAVASRVKQDTVRDEKGTTIITTYVYNGYEFRLYVRVDAVQDHNAEAAILSAWGRSVTIDGNGILSLN